MKTVSNLFKKIILASSILAVALSSSARCDLYIETFDGPLNPAIWTLDTGGNDWEVSGGILTITRSNGSNGSLTFIPQLIGDFDVQFDYSILWTNTFGFGDRLNLGLSSDTPVHSYNVFHTQEGSIGAVAVDPIPRYMFGPNTPTGAMRVSRTGSNIFMQYLDSSSNWAILQTGNDSRDMWVGLGNYIHNNFTPGSRIEIDNFRVYANQFSTPIPEPGSGALLMAASSLLSLRLGRLRSRI